MNLIGCSVIGLLVSMAVMVFAVPATPASDAQASFNAFLPRFEQGLNDFINGDPTLWKKNASHRDEGVIMGAWGAVREGLERCRPTLRLGRRAIPQERRESPA